MFKLLCLALATTSSSRANARKLVRKNREKEHRRQRIAYKATKSGKSNCIIIPNTGFASEATLLMKRRYNYHHQSPNCKEAIVDYYLNTLNLTKSETTRPKYFIRGEDDADLEDLWTIIIPKDEEMFDNFNFHWPLKYSRKTRQIGIWKVNNFEKCYPNHVADGRIQSVKVYKDHQERYTNNILLRTGQKLGWKTYPGLGKGDPRLEQWPDSWIIGPQARNECNITQVHTLHVKWVHRHAKFKEIQRNA